MPKDSAAEPKEPEPPQEAASGSHVSGHQVASGLTRGVGILSAISVPDMEGVAGLSLGVEGQVPEPYSIVVESPLINTLLESLHVLKQLLS